MRITLLISVIVGLIAEGPAEFGGKVRERLRQSGVPLPPLREQPRANALVAQGELSKALLLEAGGSWWLRKQLT